MIEPSSIKSELNRQPRKKMGVETIDRLPPHSPESEMGSIGCALLEPKEVMPEIIQELGGCVDAYYDLRHQTIVGTMMEMYDKGEAIDLITVQQHLKNNQLLDQVGGIAYLSALPDVVPSAANIKYYLDIIREKYLLRRTIHVCSDVVGRVYDFEGEVDTLMDSIERDILKISQSRIKGRERGIKELTRAAMVRIEERFNRQGKISGLETGFIDFDQLTDGMHGGEMIILAGRPGTGKTSLAMNIAEHVAVDLRLPTGVFSLEMSDESLVERMLASRSKVNLKDVNRGNMVEGDFVRLTNAGSKISTAPLFIDETPGQSIIQIRAKSRRWHQQHGIKLIVIDYLQLATSTSKKADNRQQEISDISQGIKAIAKELKIPVIALSQLNRDMEKGKPRRPMLADLRESGSIEQDGDVIGLLHRDMSQPEDSPVMQVNLLIAKQRNGPTGIDVPLVFEKRFTRFESASRIIDQDVPPPTNGRSWA